MGNAIMTSEQFIEIRRLIENEFSRAVTKHPDFCDKMIDQLLDMTWNEIERGIKLRNDRGPFTADNILGEEVAEAFNAYQQGDKKHALQELAQCGAVILRIMAKVDEENRKAKIRRLSSLERKEFLGNVKSIAGNDGFKTKWEKILSQFILNNLAPMNEEINVLRNFAQGVSQRYEKAERSAREQDNHHYYKIFADGVKTLLEAL